MKLLMLLHFMMTSSALFCALISCPFEKRINNTGGVQLNFTPEMEVFYMLFDRCHSKNRKRSLKHHIKYRVFEPIKG